jgi:hypothetical protein
VGGGSGCGAVDLPRLQGFATDDALAATALAHLKNDRVANLYIFEASPSKVGSMDENVRTDFGFRAYESPVTLLIESLNSADWQCCLLSLVSRRSGRFHLCRTFEQPVDIPRRCAVDLLGNGIERCTANFYGAFDTARQNIAGSSEVVFADSIW